MFIIEKVSENDKALYEKIFPYHFYMGLSEWLSDKENGRFIVCHGKIGVETPVFFYMWFKETLISFSICLTEYFDDSIIRCKISAELDSCKQDIEHLIRSEYQLIKRICSEPCLPANLSNHSFEFKVSEPYILWCHKEMKAL